MEHVKNTLIKLAREALALEVEEAEPAGTLGFMARFLIQATQTASPTRRISSGDSGWWSVKERRVRRRRI
jgi:hypothetical protein